MDSQVNLIKALSPVREWFLQAVRAAKPAEGSLAFQGGLGLVYVKGSPDHDEEEVLPVVVAYGTNYHQHTKTQKAYTWYSEAPEIVEAAYKDDQFKPSLETAMRAFARNRDAWVKYGCASAEARPLEKYIAVIFNRIPFITVKQWTNVGNRERKLLMSYRAHLPEVMGALVMKTDLWVGHGKTVGWALFDELLGSMPGAVPWIKTANLSNLGSAWMALQANDASREYYDLYR